MSTIEITANGLAGNVLIDGVPVPHASGVDVCLRAGNVPFVRVTLAPVGPLSIVLKNCGAQFAIDPAHFNEYFSGDFQHALFDFLQSKFNPSASRPTIPTTPTTDESESI